MSETTYLLRSSSLTSLIADLLGRRLSFIFASWQRLNLHLVLIDNRGHVVISPRGDRPINKANRHLPSRDLIGKDLLDLAMRDLIPQPVRTQHQAIVRLEVNYGIVWHEAALSHHSLRDCI